MSDRRTDELLYDSEATLRLVDRVLGELCAAEPPLGEGTGAGRSARSDLPRILAGAHGEIISMLDAVRQNRHVPGEADTGHEAVDRTDLVLAELEDRLTRLAGSLDPENFGMRLPARSRPWAGPPMAPVIPHPGARR